MFLKTATKLTCALGVSAATSAMTIIIIRSIVPRLASGIKLLLICLRILPHETIPARIPHMPINTAPVLVLRASFGHHSRETVAISHRFHAVRYNETRNEIVSHNARFPHTSRTMHLARHGTGWRAQIQRNGRRMSKKFATKRDAEAWGIKQEASTKASKHGWHTFGEAVERYADTYTIHKADEDWERNCLKRLVSQIGESVPVGSIDTELVAKWRDSRLSTVAGSTVLRESNLMRSVFRAAREEWKWMETNPFKGLSLPKHNPPRTALWTAPLIKQVLRAPRTGKTAEVVRAFRVSLHTGLRLQEALTAEFDPRRKVLVLPKTKPGLRQEIPLLRRALKLFPAAPYTVNPNEASTLFSKLCRELLITGLTFHDARASALTWLSRKMDVLTLARISRHRDLRILNEHYYRETTQDISTRLQGLKRSGKG